MPEMVYNQKIVMDELRWILLPPRTLKIRRKTMLGTQDLLVVLAVALVIFGRKRLPGLVKGMREGVKHFKESLSESDGIDITPKKDKEGATTGRSGEKAEHSLRERKE
jgi:sec-independent protein translocase protein TatA